MTAEQLAAITERRAESALELGCDGVVVVCFDGNASNSCGLVACEAPAGMNARVDGAMSAMQRHAHEVGGVTVSDTKLCGEDRVS